MIHKHDISTAISDLRQALDHVEHYSGRPEVFCLKQLLVNPLAYLLSEVISRADQGESPGTDVQQLKAEIAALANELEDFNSRRVAPYGRITEIAAKMRQLSAV